MRTYVEYGYRLEALVAKARASLAANGVLEPVSG